ncbi:enolase-phosphatase e1 [Anaeramoeba flamelloides]|uniref:Enolase-phosphatase e1 n=1 Tax=Anaeramoeba flamelloides TaxID=1746091 RepID=A0ABQ8XM19_9EUKA|nr:enolase-phosphatase e1 [Anaeramoeba flamelloides]
MKTNLHQPFTYQQTTSSITLLCFHETDRNATLKNQTTQKEHQSEDTKLQITLEKQDLTIRFSNKLIIEGKLYSSIDPEIEQISETKNTTSIILFKTKKESWPILVLDKTDKGEIDPYSEFNLSNYALNNEKDQEKAIEFLVSSANKNCLQGMITLANSYTHPNRFGIETSTIKAIEWWGKAYDVGCSPTAELSLGLIYFNQKKYENISDRNQNLELAKKWFSLVDSHPVASCSLGKIELEKAENGNNNENVDHIQVHQECFKAASQYFQKAAIEMSYPEAFFYLGVMNIKGYLGEGKDFIKGKDFILMAITQKNTFSIPSKYSQVLTQVYQYEKAKRLESVDFETIVIDQTPPIVDNMGKKFSEEEISSNDEEENSYISDYGNENSFKDESESESKSKSDGEHEKENKRSQEKKIGNENKYEIEKSQEKEIGTKIEIAQEKENEKEKEIGNGNKNEKESKKQSESENKNDKEGESEKENKKSHEKEKGKEKEIGNQCENGNKYEIENKVESENVIENEHPRDQEKSSNNEDEKEKENKKSKENGNGKGNEIEKENHKEKEKEIETYKEKAQEKEKEKEKEIENGNKNEKKSKKQSESENKNEKEKEKENENKKYKEKEIGNENKYEKEKTQEKEKETKIEIENGNKNEKKSKKQSKNENENEKEGESEKENKKSHEKEKGKEKEIGNQCENGNKYEIENKVESENVIENEHSRDREKIFKDKDENCSRGSSENDEGDEESYDGNEEYCSEIADFGKDSNYNENSDNLNFFNIEKTMKAKVENIKSGELNMKIIKNQIKNLQFQERKLIIGNMNIQKNRKAKEKHLKFSKQKIKIEKKPKIVNDDTFFHWMCALGVFSALGIGSLIYKNSKK